MAELDTGVAPSVFSESSDSDQVKQDLVQQLASYQQYLLDREAYRKLLRDNIFDEYSLDEDFSPSPYTIQDSKTVALHVTQNGTAGVDVIMAWINTSELMSSGAQVNNITILTFQWPFTIESCDTSFVRCICVMDIWVPRTLFLELCKHGVYGKVSKVNAGFVSFPPLGTIDLYALSVSGTQLATLDDAIEISHKEWSIIDFASAPVAHISLLQLFPAHQRDPTESTHYWVSFPYHQCFEEGAFSSGPISVKAELRGIELRSNNVAVLDAYPELMSSTALVLHDDPLLDCDSLIQALLVAGCGRPNSWPLIPCTLLNGGELLFYRIGGMSNHEVPDYIYRRAFPGFYIELENPTYTQPADAGLQFLSDEQVTNFRHQTISQSPMPNFDSPASFMTASSPASYMTARSAYASPAYSTSYGPSPAIRIATIREDEPPDPSLSRPLQQIHEDYYSTLHQQNIIQPFDQEVNWSGKGQHVTFMSKEPVPLTTLSHLGSSITATVDKVLCRRIALARKTMRCSRQWTVADALREVYHLQNLRHHHIIQLVGTYLQGRNFSILLYPVANFHLGIFLEDTSDMKDDPKRSDSYFVRIPFLQSTFYCLSSAVAYIHENTTKHMDIKPQNILIRETDDLYRTFRVYLADFGLSRNFDSQGHSQTDGPTSRTPRYCAPEVYSYGNRGRSADIFSLGCVFLEVCTVLAGKTLQEFADERRGDGDDESFHSNLERVLKWINVLQVLGIEFDYVPLNLVVRFKTSDLVDIVARMIHQEPGERPRASEILQISANAAHASDSHIFAPQDCCRLPPEPYELYNPES